MAKEKIVLKERQSRSSYSYSHTTAILLLVTRATTSHEFLGQWVAEQRRRYRLGKLPPHRVSTLQTVDPQFSLKPLEGDA